MRPTGRLCSEILSPLLRHCDCVIFDTLCVCGCVIHLSEDDWEASHFAVVGGEGSSLPSEALHHDDAILRAMPTTNSNHTPTPPIEEEVCT